MPKVLRRKDGVIKRLSRALGRCPVILHPADH
jgi:hypothetical protein